MPIRFPQEGNIWYPLPPDYPDLDPRGQRLARMNAFAVQETPDDLVNCWALFRSHYLMWEGAGWYKDYLPSAPFHHQMVRDIGQYPYNSVAAPRGSAKSVVVGCEVPMMLFLTRPRFTTLLVMPRQSAISDRFSNRFQFQLDNNQRIIDDFGRVRPGAGQGTWNTEALTNVRNRSILKALPARGGQLGERPDLIIVDDVENDPVLQVASTELIQQFESFLTNILLPMLRRGGTSIYWIGTLLSKRCFLYYILTNRDDVRFKYWSRRLLDAEDDGHGNLLWPEMWSREQLDEDRERLGLRAYNAQRRNRPGDGDTATLPIHDELGQYSVEDADESYASPSKTPLESNAKLVSWADTGGTVEKVERPLGESVKKMFRVMTFDYAVCNTPTSDFVCFTVFGIESSQLYKDTWWVLDSFLARIQGEQLYKKMFHMALRWRVQYIGIEAVAAQEECVRSAEAYLPGIAERYGWAPRIYPIRYPTGISKEERINALQWRYGQNRIKYPMHLRRDTRNIAFRELYRQTEGFTGEKGCLQYDDALDTVAMVPFLVGRGRKHTQSDVSRTPGRVDLVQSLREGQLYLPNSDIAVVGGIPLELMTADMVDELDARSIIDGGRLRPIGDSDSRRGPMGPHRSAAAIRRITRGGAK